MNKLLDKKGVTDLLGVSTRTVDRLRAAGDLRAVKLRGGRQAAVRFEAEAVDRLVKKKMEK